MPGEAVLSGIVHFGHQEIPDEGILIFRELTEGVEEFVLEKNRIPTEWISIHQGRNGIKGANILQLKDSLVAETDESVGVNESGVEVGVHGWMLKRKFIKELKSLKLNIKHMWEMDENHLKLEK